MKTNLLKSILFFAAILCATSVSAWRYKTSANGWSCTGSGFTAVTMKSGKSVDVLMLKDVGDGVNIIQNDDCSGQKLYCKWTKTSGDIFRGTARWNNGLYCDETVVIPGGKVYIKVGSGTQVQMTAGTNYTYTADVTFSNIGQSYTIFGGTVSGATISAENSMPSAGKPNSLTMSNSYTSANSGSVRITFDLKTNKVTETILTPTFKVGDKVFLDIRNHTGWENGSAKMYVQFNNSTTGSTSNRAEMTKIGTYLYMYTFTENYYNNVRLWRGDGSNMWNYTVEVTTGGEGVLVSNGGWSGTGTKYSFSLTSLTTPTMTATPTTITLGESTTLEVTNTIELNYKAGTTSYTTTPQELSYTFKNGSTQLSSGSSKSYIWTPASSGTHSTTATVSDSKTGLSATSTNTSVTVTAASGHKITYEEGDYWTYTNNPSSAEEGEEVKFDVTPDAGYSLKVTSNDVNVSNSNGNTYTFTMPDKDVTINVTAEEILTEVTINVNPTGSGTLKVGGNDFTANERVNVGVATTKQVVVTPVSGYKFSNWSTTGNATNTGSTAQTTLKGNGNGDKGTLTATLARTYAFIQGRFRVYNSGRTAYTTTYAAGGQWKVNSTSLKMEYDEIKHQHFLRTYMTPKELSETHGQNCGECIPFFYIKTSTSETKFESETSYKSNSSVELKTAGDKKTLYNHTGSTDTNNANLKFNSTDESGYAILYFDEASVWYELECELKYDANGGTGTAPSRTYYSSGATTTTAAANTFTNANGTFKEWNTKQDGTGDSYSAGSTITITKNTTLYAQWQSQTLTYTITFERQSGNGGTSSATVQYQNNNYSVNPVVAPTRTDYTFGGYYTQAEGEGVQVVSAAGEWLKSVTGYTDASGNWIKNSSVTTLYAKWISNSTSTEGLPTDVYLVGSFGRWDLNDDKQQFKKATADATIYTLTWTFDAAKTYEFKVSVAGEFRGLDNNNEITVEKTSLTIPSTGNNCKITTTEAGEYIFTWDSETNTLSVEYPSDKVSLTFFGDGGTVGAVADSRVLTSPAKVKPGTSVTFTATPDANNAFSQWKKNGEVVSTDLTYTCTIDADATIEAVFLKPTTVFLKPHDEWKFNNARFAIYYWKSKQDNGWVDLKQLTCHNEYYTADVPVGYSQLKFVRLNPANKDHNFNDGTCWNQTTDLTLPTNGNNLYDLTKIYLKPNAQWKSNEARFAAYFFHSDFGEDKAWMSMLPTSENGVYYCDVPTDKLYNKVSFVRMDGKQSTNDWGNRWNQSKDIDLYNGSIVWYR